MKAFTTLTGKVAAMDRANVDTDQIIPKQFLKRIERTGFGEFLFWDWARRDDGTLNPDFELNRPEAKGATILLARRNFGSGSSREHAPWALEDYGFRVVVAPSFADIFYNNSLKNGLLLIKLDTKIVDRLFKEAAAAQGYRLAVDLENQTVSTPGGESFKFDIDPFAKHSILNGLDEIGLSLEHADKIKAFEAQHRSEQPWLFA
jgi:3-isopropylmalate/(R)-2-methylmalate dehydratase small subunit